MDELNWVREGSSWAMGMLSVLCVADLAKRERWRTIGLWSVGGPDVDLIRQDRPSRHSRVASNKGVSMLLSMQKKPMQSLCQPYKSQHRILLAQQNFEAKMPTNNI